MPKRKNHTSHNQSRKNHRNGALQCIIMCDMRGLRAGAGPGVGGAPPCDVRADLVPRPPQVSRRPPCSATCPPRAWTPSSCATSATRSTAPVWRSCASARCVVCVALCVCVHRPDASLTFLLLPRRVFPRTDQRQPHQQGQGPPQGWHAEAEYVRAGAMWCGGEAHACLRPLQRTAA